VLYFLRSLNFRLQNTNTGVSNSFSLARLVLIGSFHAEFT
jgi:hypothetical protein